MLKMSACQKQAPKSNRGCTGYATDNSQLLFSILSSQKWTQLYSNLVNLSTQDTHQSIGWKWHFTVDKYSLPYFTGKIQFSGSPRSSNVKKCLSLCRYIYIRSFHPMNALLVLISRSAIVRSLFIAYKREVEVTRAVMWSPNESYARNISELNLGRDTRDCYQVNIQAVNPQDKLSSSVLGAIAIKIRWDSGWVCTV